MDGIQYIINEEGKKKLLLLTWKNGEIYGKNYQKKSLVKAIILKKKKENGMILLNKLTGV